MALQKAATSQDRHDSAIAQKRSSWVGAWINLRLIMYSRVTIYFIKSVLRRVTATLHK